MFMFRRKVVDENGQELKQAHLGGGEPEMYYCKEKKRWRQKKKDGEESSEDEKPLAPPPMGQMKRAIVDESPGAIPQWNPYAQLRKKQAKKNIAQTNVAQFNPAGPFGESNRPHVEAVVAATNPFAPNELVATQDGAEVASSLAADFQPISFESRFQVPAPDQNRDEETEINENTSGKPFAADRYENPTQMVEQDSASVDMAYEAYEENFHLAPETVQQDNAPVEMECEAYDENFHEPPDTVQRDFAPVDMESEAYDEHFYEPPETVQQDNGRVNLECEAYDENFHEPPDTAQQDFAPVDMESEAYDENFDVPPDTVQQDNAPVNMVSEAYDENFHEPPDTVQQDFAPVDLKSEAYDENFDEPPDTVQQDNAPVNMGSELYDENLELHDRGVVEADAGPFGAEGERHDENLQEVDDLAVVEPDAGFFAMENELFDENFELNDTGVVETDAAAFPAESEQYDANLDEVRDRGVVAPDADPFATESGWYDENLELQDLGIVEPDASAVAAQNEAYDDNRNELHDRSVVEPGGSPFVAQSEPFDAFFNELDDLEVVQPDAGPFRGGSEPFPVDVGSEADEKIFQEPLETVEHDKSLVDVESEMHHDNRNESQDLAVVESDTSPLVAESKRLPPREDEPKNAGLVKFDTGFFMTESEAYCASNENMSRKDSQTAIRDYITCASTVVRRVSGSVETTERHTVSATEVEKLMRDHANMLTRALEAERLLAAEKTRTMELEKKIQALTGESQNGSTTVASSDLSVDSQLTLDQCAELVDMLVQNASNQFMVKAACLQLERVTAFDNRESVVKNGGVEAIFSVLKKYDKNGEIVLTVANVLRNLTFCDEAVDAVAKSEKMSVILNILDYHQDAKIAAACCGSIMNLCCSVDNRKALFMSDGLACLVRTVEKHPNTANVLENACQALYITALHGKNRVVDAGGLRVPKLMATHTSRSVKKWGKWLQEIIQ